MYAQVVVLTYQSPDIQTYTYEIPKILQSRIQIGQLVSVPFGKRTPTGIITGINPEETLLGLIPAKIKPITSILAEQPLLVSYQIELLKWMADYYFAPMVNCLETMLPEIPKRHQKLQSTVNRSPREALSGVEGAKRGQPLTVSQTLVLVPNINRIPQTLANFPQAKNYVIYHNELNLSQKFNTWQKILGGGIDYIFGARSAIFAPCPNLKGIIIYDEHDGSYKDERSPYYDTLTVAEKISELTNCKIEIIDPAPKVTTYFNHQKEILLSSRAERSDLKTKIASSPAKPDPRNDRTVKTQVVSMLSEKAAGNKSPISGLLENYIELGFKKNKKILLFLNKKTESGHFYCKNCKYSDFAKLQPETCPNCASRDIWFNTVNITTLTALVKQIVPNANVNIIADINRQQSSIRQAQDDPEFIEGSALSTQGSIDVATAAVFYRLAVQKYNLVAHIRTDSILAISDFSSTERLFWQITDLKKITQGLLLLQTYDPESEVIRAASGNNYLKFYKSELTMRKTLLYPPFALLVKLSLKGKLEDAVEQKAQKLYEDLSVATSQLPARQSLGGGGSTVSILGPFKPIFSGKVPKYNIIAKMPISSYSLKEREKALNIIQPILRTLPRVWQVEVEPASIND